MSKNSLLRNLGFAWITLSVRNRWRLVLAIFLSAFVAILEFISIASLVPFLTIFLEGAGSEIPLQKIWLVNSLNGLSSSDLRLIVVCVPFLLSVTAICKSISIRYIGITASEAGNYISIKVVRSLLQRSFQGFLSSSVSEALDDFAVQLAKLHFLFLVFLQGCSNLAIVLALFSFMLLVAFRSSLTVFIILGAFYFFCSRFLSERFSRFNAEALSATRQITASVKDIFFGIRELKLYGFESVYINKHKELDRAGRRAMVNARYLATLPRTLVELLIYLLVAACMLISIVNGSLPSVDIVLVSASFISLVKLLPAIQGIFDSWAFLKANQSTFSIVRQYLQNVGEVPTSYLTMVGDHKGRERTNKADFLIAFNDVFFRYNDCDSYIIKSLDLRLNHNETLAIEGRSGSGKSTILDLASGLLMPTSGSVITDYGKLDNIHTIRNWQSSIGYASQYTYLLQGSVLQNIMGLSRDVRDDFLDFAWYCLEMAKISDFVSSLPDGINTIIGDDSKVQMSGGQRQRLGVARAIFKAQTLLILDEATSSLDSKTEEAMMSNLKKMTTFSSVLLVSHKESTLDFCDRRYTNARLS